MFCQVDERRRGVEHVPEALFAVAYCLPHESCLDRRTRQVRRTGNGECMGRAIDVGVGSARERSCDDREGVRIGWAGLAPVHGEGAEHLPTLHAGHIAAGEDRHGKTRAELVRQRQRAVGPPHIVGGDVLRDHGASGERGGTARTLGRPDRQPVDCRVVGGRQRGRGADAQASRHIEQQHGAEGAGQLRLHHLHHFGERLLERRVARDRLEDAVVPEERVLGSPALFHGAGRIERATPALLGRPRSVERRASRGLFELRAVTMFAIPNTPTVAPSGCRRRRTRASSR